MSQGSRALSSSLTGVEVRMCATGLQRADPGSSLAGTPAAPAGPPHWPYFHARFGRSWEEAAAAAAAGAAAAAAAGRRW